MQILESHLVQVERERVDLIRIVQEFERKAKLSHQQMEPHTRGGGGHGDNRGERRREQQEKNRKEDHVRGSNPTRATEIVSALEQIHSLPIETLSTLSLDQVSESSPSMFVSLSHYLHLCVRVSVSVSLGRFSRVNILFILFPQLSSEFMKL
jgi:hypothetical protein